MLICLNANSNSGAAMRKWGIFNNFLAQKKIKYELVLTKSYEDLCEALDKKKDSFENIISAGGDGTANGIINFLMARQLKNKVGAIGLGSSNDFHKPYAINRRYNNIPYILPGNGLNE